MRKFWRSLVELKNQIDYEYYWAVVGEGEPRGFRTFWLCARFELRSFYLFNVLCRFRGHDYTTNGCDYIESGGEGFSCVRCGHSFTAWH